MQRYFSLRAGESIFFETRLNAAYLGRYYLPGASIEAMYDATQHARLQGTVGRSGAHRSNEAPRSRRRPAPRARGGVPGARRGSASPSGALLPEPLFDAPLSYVLEARDGTLLGARIAADGQWRFPPRATVPVKFRRALHRVRGQALREHVGVDALAIARAVKLNLQRGAS